MVKDIKAVTYYLEDGLQKSITLEQDQIFTSQVSERALLKHLLLLPGVIDGAVIEYSYKKTTPYLGISDWYFQSDIPKVRSQFDLAILGNYQYNMMLLWFFDLDKNESSVKDYCMELPDGRVSACAIYLYAKNDIPASLRKRILC